MVLTKKILQELQESLWIRHITPEQRAILFLWYGSEQEEYEWTSEDFVYGIHKVMRYYPDHRPERLPDFLLKKNIDVDIDADDVPF